MINCKEASRLLSQAQERPLNRQERAALRFHVLLCGMCRNFEKQLTFIRTAIRRYVQ